MKKVIAIIAMICCMSFCFIGCGPDTDSYAGTWVSTKASMGKMDVKFNKDNSLTIDLNEDGSALISMGEKSQTEATWEESEIGFNVTSDETLVFKTNEDKTTATIEYGGMFVTFEKK